MPALGAPGGPSGSGRWALPPTIYGLFTAAITGPPPRFGPAAPVERAAGRPGTVRPAAENAGNAVRLLSDGAGNAAVGRR